MQAILRWKLKNYLARTTPQTAHTLSPQPMGRACVTTMKDCGNVLV